jgi:chromosome segregation protein
MYLKRLEILGFKSFTERTPVSFSQGISAVVGPNGCGKSNIIDAIRWVMGEQSPRLLRTRNMEDLLFNGSMGRSPASVAEVTLTLTKDEDGKGQAEIAVTRRLYRGGDSEYLINKMPSRLKDLVRFFIEAGMGTRAYNIIEQEKVGRLVDAPPEERRLLIDEAAGITRFKDQKKESERRLESAGQNLETVGTLLGETAKRLATVSRAAAKASKWQALKGELRELELVLSAKRFLGFSEGRDRLADEAKERRNELALAEAKNSQTELEVDNLRLAEASLNQEHETELNLFHQIKSQSDKWELEIDHLNSDLEATEKSRETALADLAGLDDERDRQREDRDRIETELTELKAENDEALETRRDLRERWVALKAECDGLAEVRNKALANLEEASDYHRRLGETLAGAESLAEHLKNRRRELSLEGNQADMTLNEAKERLASRERFKATLEEDLTAAREDAEALREDRDAARADVEAEVRKLGQAEKAQAVLSSRLDTLEAFREGGFGWYPDGAVALMRDPEARDLIAPVAETLKVPDGYEEAAEAALGDKLGWILVKDRKAGLDALILAREKGLGRCGFVSKESLNGKDLSEVLLGPIELRPSVSDEMLKSRRGFLTLEGDYLGQTFMARAGSNGEDQDAGAKGAKGGAKNGSKAGAKARPGLLASVKELEAVRAELALAEEETERIDQAARAKRQTLAEADEALSVAMNRQAALAEDLNAAASKIMVAASEVKGLAIRRDSLAGEIERNEAEMAACEKKRAQAAQDRDKLAGMVAGLEEEYRKAVAEAEGRAEALEELREKGLVAASRVDGLAERLDSLTKVRKRVADWLNNLETRRESLENLAEGLLDRQTELTDRIGELTALSENLPDDLTEREAKLADLRRQLDENRVSLLAKEEEAKRSRKTREELSRALSDLERQLMEADHGLDKINSDLLKDWRVAFDYPQVGAQVDDADGAEGETGEGEDEGDGDDGAGDGTDVDGGDETLDEPDETGDETGETDDGTAEPQLATGEGTAEDTPEAQGATGDGAEGEGAGPEGSAEEPDEGQAPVELVDPLALAEIGLPENAEATILGLREKLASLGEVNLDAIREEAELRESHDFHQKHRDDLVSAIADLRAGISRINQTCRERFSKTFELASQKFREIFPVLFEGGDGWLSLTDESDPLESGVEIHVHPPGKKIMVMRSLSGGEKTLTSLCLIFALYLIKPSPFCLLDEADAPLDEANIDRFNRLLRNLSQASQIIMVTHNKRTMQIADTLYGVTMESPGVSKLVSVNLAEAEVLTDD